MKWLTLRGHANALYEGMLTPNEFRNLIVNTLCDNETSDADLTRLAKAILEEPIE